MALAALGAVLVTVGLARWSDDTPAPERGGARAGSVRETTAPTTGGASAGIAGAAATAAPREVRAPQSPGSPRRLHLPTLGVTAPVVPVRTVGRTLVPPRDPDTLGWWADGARPGGRRGSALIAGHTVHGAAKGALDDLGRLRPGDPVTVATDRGRVRYDVVRVRVFPKASIARRAAQLFSQSVRARLVLLTCADWDGSRYLSNTVVLARPVTGA